jgi:phosphatidylglycerophosphate synthase
MRFLLLPSLLCYLPALLLPALQSFGTAAAFSTSLHLLHRLPCASAAAAAATSPQTSSSRRGHSVHSMRGGGASSSSRDKPVIPPSAPGLVVLGGEGGLGEIPGHNTPTLWNVPNILTLARLASIPVFAAVFYTPADVLASRNFWCAGIFAGAALTDWLDGWWARRYNIASPFGAFLDPVADKLMVAVALILLSERLGVWMTVCTSIILSREIGVSALREWMAQIGARGVVKVHALHIAFLLSVP